MHKRLESLVQSYRSLLLAVGLQCLLVSPHNVVSAEAMPENGATDATAIMLYRPIAYYGNDGNSFSGERIENTPAEQALLALLAQVDMNVAVRYPPLKRALSLFALSEDGCIVVPTAGDGAGDLMSEVFYHNPFWLYVLRSSGITSFAEISRYGTINGADAMTGRVLFEDIERSYAPNFQSLIGMLRSGRVQAIPLGELALVNEPDLENDMVRLREEPLIRIEMRIRCKRTARNQTLVDKVNAILAASPAP